MSRPARADVVAVDVFVVHRVTRGWRVLTLQRAEGTRCAGAWETVHGRIEDGESPHGAALREVQEETGLFPDRLYNVTTNAFYLHRPSLVVLAPVFCAFVDRPGRIQLGDEHVQSEWLTRAAAMKRFAWPSEREHLARAWALLRRGHAGPLEDVLRVL